MPELSRFYGVVIRMHFGDHAPPHFHVLYGNEEALVEIRGLAFLEGRLPARARGLVIEWASLHQEELREAWERMERHEPIGTIEPLR